MRFRLERGACSVLLEIGEANPHLFFCTMLGWRPLAVPISVEIQYRCEPQNEKVTPWLSIGIKDCGRVQTRIKMNIAGGQPLVLRMERFDKNMNQGKRGVHVFDGIDGCLQEGDWV